MSARAYKPILLCMMSYLDNAEYDCGTVFAQAQLGALTESQLEPTYPLQHYQVLKKNHLTAWNELTGHGNPTRSRKLNHLIRKVKRKEVRGQGALSRARRSIMGHEYHQVLDILKDEGEDIVWKYGIPAMMKYQLHLISQIDCATQAKCDNLKKHNHFDFALKTKLDWSKNVMEEQDAP